MLWLMAGAALAKGAYDAYQGQEQAKDAEESGRASAALIREETAEEVRRLERENDYVMGRVRALQGASGIQANTGTAKIYRDAMQGEMQREIDWTKRAGESRAKIAHDTGQYTASAAKSRGASSLIGSGIRALSYADNYYGWTSKN